MALIFAFAGNYNPRGWLLCFGQLMSISQNSALFSLVGTTYGGDGQTTFGLPDLRGRAPIGAGQAPGLQSYNLGQNGGTETVTLTIQNMPMHIHPVDANLIVTPSATTAAGTSAVPGPTLVPSLLPTIGGGPSATSIKGYGVANGSTTMAASAVSGNVGIAGGSQPTGIRNPYLAVNYIICAEGIYPSRN